MPTFSFKPAFAVGGRAFQQSKNISCNGIEVVEPPAKIPIAKLGSLTTRTDNDTGVVTLSAGHGVITGDRIALFWEIAGVKGKRYGMTSVVAGNAVTVDLGAGDNLPIATTPIILAVQREYPCTFLGDNLKAISYYSQKTSIFEFTDVAAALIAAHYHPDDGMATGWYDGNGVANVFAGTTVAKVFLAHNDLLNSKEMRAGFGV